MESSIELLATSSFTDIEMVEKVARHCKTLGPMHQGNIISTKR